MNNSSSEIEKYGLKYNPFPRREAEQYLNSPEKLHIILFEKEKRILEKFSEEVSNATVNFVVHGPWGTGKTLFLIYFYNPFFKVFLFQGNRNFLKSITQPFGSS